MRKADQAIKSVAIIAIFTMLSKVLGFFREIVIAAKFGVGIETDTFFMAISIITLFTGLFIVTLNTAFIPILIEVEKKESRTGKVLHGNNALNTILLVALVLFFVIEISAPLIVRLFAPGFTGTQLSQLIWYVRLGMPLLFIAGILGITRGYLQSEMIFFESAVAYIPFNLIYLVYLFLLSTKFGISGLILVHIVAFTSQLLIQLPALRRSGFRYQAYLNLKDPYIRKMGVLLLPVLAGVAVQDINIIIDKSLASGLEVGSISALNYAVKLNTLVQVIFVTALSTVLFPLLSKAFQDGDKIAQKSLIQKGVIVIVLIALPAMAGLLLLRQEIVTVAFLRGKFDQRALVMTAGSLFYYALGLVPMALRVFFHNIFYSIQDTRTPLYNGIVTVVSNFIFSVILMQFMAYKGLALGTSLSVTITLVFMVYVLKQKSINFLDRSLILKMIKIGISTMVMAVVVVVSKYLTPATISTTVQLLIMIVAGIGAYFISIKALRIEEFEWFIRLSIARFKR